MKLFNAVLSVMKRMKADYNKYDIPRALITPPLYAGDIVCNCGDIGLDFNDPEVQKSIRLTPFD